MVDRCREPRRSVMGQTAPTPYKCVKGKEIYYCNTYVRAAKVRGAALGWFAHAIMAVAWINLAEWIHLFFGGPLSPLGS